MKLTELSLSYQAIITVCTVELMLVRNTNDSLKHNDDCKSCDPPLRLGAGFLRKYASFFPLVVSEQPSRLSNR